ncbi:MAG: Nif11 domain/cupin domain-containing protein [Synechococcus sp.]|nr:Nif11 domain/cupin domain-containing protein [Synechococcus sp.]
MAEAQLQQFLDKVRQLNAFVALSEADPVLRRTLRDCEHHDEVVALARRWGFEIGRRWGEAPTMGPAAPATTGESGATGATSEMAVEGATGRIVPLLAGDCPAPGEEHSALLLQRPQLRLERIHSCQAVSPPGFWYDQAETEWLLLLQGTARLRFADEAAERCLQPGDSLWIEAHRRHRVTATDAAPGTIWLALFWREH